MINLNKSSFSAKVPFFSILIPSYNRPEYLAKCIDSILDNNFSDYEIVISDDNSPRVDEIEQVLQPYLKNNKVRFFRQQNNLREPANKNFLVNQARGKFNVILGDDDKLYPYTLSKINDYIEKNHGYKLYSFGYTVIDENDDFYYSRRAPRNIEINLNNPSIVRYFFISSIFPFWLYHPATFCCRNGLEKELPYSDEAGIGEDLLFLFDLINKGEKIFVIPENLFKWRKVQSDKTQGQKNQSLADFTNCQARRNILYHLEKKRDINPIIKEIISSYEFRKNFLYTPIIVDENLSEGKVLKLALSETHLDEYNSFSNKTNFFSVHFKPYVRRSLSFIHLFGFRGLINVLQVGFQRFYYRLKTLFKSCLQQKSPDIVEY